jgi:hypothetical protein
LVSVALSDRIGLSYFDKQLDEISLAPPYSYRALATSHLCGIAVHGASSRRDDAGTTHHHKRPMIAKLQDVERHFLTFQADKLTHNNIGTQRKRSRCVSSPKL